PARGRPAHTRHQRQTQLAASALFFHFALGPHPQRLPPLAHARGADSRRLASFTTLRIASAARRLAPGPPSLARTRASPSRIFAARARSVSIDTASRATASGVNVSWISSGTIVSPAIRFTIP